MYYFSTWKCGFHIAMDYYIGNDLSYDAAARVIVRPFARGGSSAICDARLREYVDGDDRA
jgi:hypothetical protein